MASDPTVAKAIQVTFVFAAIAIPLTMLSSLTFAALLNSRRLFGKSFFRTLFYMPVQIPLVASTLVWIGFLNTETGWLNQILGAVGLPQPSWLTSETWIYPALSIIGLWGVGNFMLINLAGMQTVPTELYEAAKIDGAGAWKQFRNVTIPMISPILLYNLIIALVGTFQYFTQAYVLTNGRGDPNNATLFINLDLFREAFVYNKMGYGSAIAWLLFVLVMILTLAIFGLPAAGSTTPAASDDRQGQGAAAAGVQRRRTRLADVPQGLGRASITPGRPHPERLPCCRCCTTMTAFQQPGQSSTPGAPFYPAKPQTGIYQGEDT